MINDKPLVEKCWSNFISPVIDKFYSRICRADPERIEDSILRFPAYGYAAYDTSRMSDTQIPVYVLSEDPENPKVLPQKIRANSPFTPA